MVDGRAKRMLKAHLTSPKSIQLRVSAQKSWPTLILLQIKVRKKEVINLVPSLFFPDVNCRSNFKRISSYTKNNV